VESIFIEFARDCGVIAHQKNLYNIFVSNGYDTPESVKMMGEFLDSITIDFKGNAEPNFTRKFIGVPDPQPIFDTLIEIRDKTKIHVEITDLIMAHCMCMQFHLHRYLMPFVPLVLESYLYPQPFFSD
jgi:pyruvate formate lyase activating enzyme